MCSGMLISRQTHRPQALRSGLSIASVIFISTDNSEALAAIHEFLRFQINEHRTGDALQ
jgi:hypothetical protein